MKMLHGGRAWRVYLMAAALGIWLGGGTAVLGAGYQMKIAYSGYTGRSETLTNFPVLVVLSNNVGGASGFNFNGFVTTNGYDLRFATNSTGTNWLNHEIESWNTNAGQASYVWVQVPTIPGDGSGAIWAKWGDTAASNQLACTTNGATWTNGFAGVWHMGQTNAQDSTSNRNHGTSSNNTTAIGFIAGAQRFNGSSAYIDVGNAASVQITGSTLTESAWINPAAAVAYGTILSKRSAYYFQHHSNQTLGVYMYGTIPAQYNYSADTAPLSTWTHAAMVYDGNVLRFYLNGVESGRTNRAGTITTASYNLKIAWDETGGARYWNGLLDEVRLCNVARSSNWVWACYQTMASNTSFSAYGAVAEPPATLPQILNQVATNVLGASADISGTLVTNGGSSAWVYLFCATNDCTTNEAAWIAAGAVTTNFGPFTSGAAFTNTLTGFSSNTWYYWNHMASNASDKAWAALAGSPSFKTLGPPVVNNGAGATSIGSSSAVLNGVLTNGAPAHVFVNLWADGAGTTNIYELGSRSLGGFSTNVSGLLATTAYSYQCFASNAYGTAWATAASNFTTLAKAKDFRMKIAFAGYNRTETLTNFPVLVVLSNNVGGSQFNYSNFVTTNGNDLRFVVNLEDAGSLNYEIESWNTGGVSYVWVQVPTIPGDGSGSIWAKWGDTAASNQLACTTNGTTWTNGYVGVWHLKEVSNGPYYDSTSNRVNSTGGTASQLSGQTGYGQSFNGSANVIDFTSSAALSNQSLTVEFWVNPSAPNQGVTTLLDYDHSGSPLQGWVVQSEDALGSGYYYLAYYDGATFQPSGQFSSGKGVQISNSQWQHVAYTKAGTAVIGYRNGATAWTPGTASSSTISYQAGKYVRLGSAVSTASRYAKGVFDEVRISATARSSNWVWACYQTMSSNTAFSAYSQVEAPVADEAALVNGVATNILDASAALSGTLVTNGSSSAWIYLFCATNDCTTNEAAWIAAGAVTTNFGPFTSGAAFTNTLPGLASNTWYYWNHMASNASSLAWAATTSSPSFKTLGPPVVNNGAGATSIGMWSAVLNGVLTNGAPAHVFVHLWADGSGTTNIYELGSRSQGGFSTNVGGLLAATPYSYQCFGSNAYGTAWAAAASNFTTMAALTNGDVTWSGAAGGGNRNWNTASNWVGNLAPTNPTAATIYFKTNGQAVVGLLEADRQIGGVSFDSGVNFSNIVHVVDLNGCALTLAGNLSSAIYRGWNFRLTNGTLRLGTVATAANLTVGSRADATLTMSPGTFLDTVNLGSVSMGEHDGSGQGTAILDLRGCQVVGGVLRMRSLTMAGYNKSSFIYMDGITVISSIEVSNTVSLGASFGPGGWLVDASYIGNPADSGNLPANISLKIGSSPAQRGDLIVNKVGGTIGTRTDKIVATSGGTFTAYLTNLWVAANGANAGDSQAQYGLLDISRMNSCSVDALDVRLGVPASPLSTDNIKGEWRVCSGTVTAGTVVVGASTGKGYGLLALSNTLFTVTNSLTLNTRGTNLVSVGTDPSGLDIQGTLVDSGGAVRVSFFAAPAVGTNWAIRIKGDAQSTLNAMIGASPSRLTSTGTYPNKKAGVLYDTAADYTYYALADSNAFSTLPVAIAHDERTYEIAPAGTVVIGTNDINNGSSDPDSRPLTLTIYTNGGPESASLTFDAAGDYGVTLKVAANSDSATDTCTVHVVAVNPGVTNALTWKGGAPTALMDRREWMWSANWVEGVPPTNPTIGTINYKTDGQSVTGLLEQSRTVGGLNFDSLSVAASITHALNLGGHTLTVAGSVDSESSRNWTMRMTNGTLRLGSVSQTASLRVGRLGAATLALAPGMVLDPVNVATLSLGEHSSSGSGLCVLDLRGCALLGGVLRLRDLTLTSYSSDGYLYLDSGTGLGSIEVTNTLSIGMSIGSGNTYIGNPADGKLPANVSIKVGTDAARRGNLHLTRVSTYAAARTDKLVATSGGTFTAYLTNLWISANHGVNSSSALYGLLDVARMDSCALDIQSLLLAPDRATGPLATDKYQGELRLGPGTVTLGTGVVGANTNAGFGLLAMSNTTFTVTDTLVINRSGRVEISVDSQPCGVVISNAAGSALSLATATNGAIRIAFRAPYTVRPHYGLAWVGDHEQALKDLQADGRLVVDSTGLAPKMAEVFLCNDVTYVGIQRPIGSVYRFR